MTWTVGHTWVVGENPTTAEINREMARARDQYMMETVEATANIDSLSDDVYLLAHEKQRLLTKILAQHRRVMNLLQENQQLSKANERLRHEIFGLSIDSSRYDWYDDSMPWGFSDN